MSIEIKEEKENKLFKRKEVRGVLRSEITPSRKEVLDLLSKKFSVSPEKIKIKSIKGNFGTKDFTIRANIYNSEEEKNILEIKKKKESPPIKEEAAAQ